MAAVYLITVETICERSHQLIEMNKIILINIIVTFFAMFMLMLFLRDDSFYCIIITLVSHALRWNVAAHVWVFLGKTTCRS